LAIAKGTCYIKVFGGENSQKKYYFCSLEEFKHIKVYCHINRGFVFNFFDVAKMVIVRKFGYILDMKIPPKKNLKKRILLYSWLPIRTYHKNLTIWVFFSLKIWQNFAKKQFAHYRHFCEVNK
jgi:hypothetical protein